MYPASSKTHTHSTRSLFGWLCLDSLYGWFLNSENFHSSQYTPHPVILRGAEGEVAESIIHQITLALREREDCCRLWVSAGEEHFRQNS